MFWIASVEWLAAVQTVLSEPIHRPGLVLGALIVVAVDAQSLSVVYMMLLAPLALYPSPDLDFPFRLVG